MRITACVTLAATLILSACSSGFDTTPQIQFADISGVFSAEVNQVGFGRLVMTMELVENARTVYTAELSNFVDGEIITSEAIGTLADDHLILNFDRGSDSDFYFESRVMETDLGFIELHGRFILPDSQINISAEFIQPLSES